MTERYLVGFLFLWLVSMTSQGRSEDTLAAQVEAVLASPGYENAHWGILVVDRSTGEVLFERNADRLFQPASVTKLFSVSAALMEFGPDHRFQTTVKRTKEVGKDGILLGDLILVASGDLSLGGRTGPDGSLIFKSNDHSYAGGSSAVELVSDDPLAPLAGLDSLAREVAAAGIKSVNNVIVDDRLFDPAESTGSGPSRVSPIVMNDNLIDFVIAPAEQAGLSASLRMVPATAYVAIENQIETVVSGTAASVEVVPVGDRRIQVRGRIPVGHPPIIRVHEVDNPAAFARTLFIETLRRQNVRVQGSPLASNPSERLPSIAEVANMPKVAEYTSPPLSEYLKVILKVSQNLHASTLPMLLAVKSGGRTLEAGMRRQGERLKELGLKINAFSFGGGAGGSRSDLVSPRATVALLQAMAARSDIATFEGALPVLGRDGTLAKTVPESSPARGHVRAKTGTYWVSNSLSGHVVLTSKALAGYMETTTGRPLVFAFFLNGVPLDLAPSEISTATEAAGGLLGRLCEVFHADTPASPQSALSRDEAIQADEASDGQAVANEIGPGSQTSPSALRSSGRSEGSP